VGEKFSNNATSTLASGINNSVTSFSVQSGHGARWPSLSTGDWCWTTITDGTTVEIVKVTAIVGDVFTIVRGQQGTSAASWSSGATVQLRPTQKMFEDFQTPKLVLATNWSFTNYLQSATNKWNGYGDMTLSALVRLGRVEDDDDIGRIILEEGDTYWAGYAMGYNHLRPWVKQHMNADGKYDTGSFEPNWSPIVGGTPASYGFVDYKTVLITLRASAGALSIFLGPLLYRTITPGVGYEAGLTGIRVGCNFDADMFFDGGGLAGLAYLEEGLSDSDVRTFALAVAQEADVIDAGFGWAHRISFKQLYLRHGDSVPSTVEDLGSENGDLTLNGSLAIVEEWPRWLI